MSDIPQYEFDAGVEARETLPARVAKIIGSDTEFGNFLNGVSKIYSTGALAARILLENIPGITTGYAQHKQDWGRKFLGNGGCAYIDLDHLEMPTGEVASASDFVATWHGMLRFVSEVRQRASADLNNGLRLEVLVNNSDGLGNSYGGHLSLLVTRRMFDNLFHRKLHQLLQLASFQASSIVISGQGKVGAENGAPAVDFQLSQRADFYETLVGTQTTSHRPLVNSRDESLCGSEQGAARRLARLHVIFHDSNLCHVACWLKVGLMQLVVAMIEAEQFDPRLILDDPVSEVRRWSHDPTLKHRARMAAGGRRTMVELQEQFCDAAERFCEAGGFEGIVPEAPRLIARWRDVLGKLKAGRLDELTGVLDWVLKLRILQRALSLQPELTWQSPAVKHLDHLYGSLDPNQGLYWQYERSGVVERIASDEQIAVRMKEPPSDTRAWTRGKLLQLARPGECVDVDWDRIEFRLPTAGGRTLWQRVSLPDPTGMTQAENEHLFAGSQSLREIVERLTAQPEPVEAVPAGNVDVSQFH